MSDLIMKHYKGQVICCLLEYLLQSGPKKGDILCLGSNFCETFDTRKFY